MTEKTPEQQIQEAGVLYLASYFVLSDKTSYSEDKQKAAEEYCQRTRDYLSQQGYLPDELQQSDAPKAPTGISEKQFLFPDITIASQNGPGLTIEGKKINDFIEQYFPRELKESAASASLFSSFKKP